jgi:hypothetical protein
MISVDFLFMDAFLKYIFSYIFHYLLACFSMSTKEKITKSTRLYLMVIMAMLLLKLYAIKK